METALKDKEVQGLKYFARLLPLLDRLHEVGCERDTAGNRKLFFDDYVKTVLLYMWNPLIGSMRALQKAIALPKVFKALGVRRFSLGSFSEAPVVFEPQQLKNIVEELAGELRPLSLNPRLHDVKRALTLVDSTLLSKLPDLAKAAVEGTCRTAHHGQVHGWRLHMQLELATFTPGHMDLTSARNAGEQHEARVLKRALKTNCCYVGDCAYSDRGLLDAIVAMQSSYVMRLGENIVFEVLEERELSQEALDAGVVRDAIVRLGGPGAAAMNHRVRLVELQVTPRRRRTRKATKGGAKIKGSRVSDRLLMVTDMTDLPVELVGLIYQQRYSVELFFRFFKQILGMRHLLSQRGNGVEIQVYCAVIACLLIQLQTGRKPDKRTVEMMGWFFLGVASEQDVIDHMNLPDNKGVKLRIKEALWKKLGF